jgi:hypothetical protein
MTTDTKAEERPCKNCKTTIPAQPRGPGRPRLFCSRSCRRTYFHQQEKDELEVERAAERAERLERQRFEADVWHRGTREAKKRARQRAKEREAQR